MYNYAKWSWAKKLQELRERFFKLKIDELPITLALFRNTDQKGKVIPSIIPEIISCQENEIAEFLQEFDSLNFQKAFEVSQTKVTAPTVMKRHDYEDFKQNEIKQYEPKLVKKNEHAKILNLPKNSIFLPLVERKAKRFNRKKKIETGKKAILLMHGQNYWNILRIMIAQVYTIENGGTLTQKHFDFLKELVEKAKLQQKYKRQNREVPPEIIATSREDQRIALLIKEMIEGVKISQMPRQELFHILEYLHSKSPFLSSQEEAIKTAIHTSMSGVHMSGVQKSAQKREEQPEIEEQSEVVEIEA